MAMNSSLLARRLTSSVFRHPAVATNMFRRPFSATPAALSSISDIIKSDHQDLEEAYQNILKATTHDDKTRWQNQFTWELARHSIGEELVVYPIMEKHMPDGKSRADHDRAEHQSVKEKLYKFQGLNADDAEFEPTLQSLWDDLSHHINEEEQNDLPALEQILDKNDSEDMATSFRRTKKFIPTRSHPSAPDKPPFETVAGMMAAPIDHLMDIFRKFPKDADRDMPP